MGQCTIHKSEITKLIQFINYRLQFRVDFMIQWN